MRLLDRNKQTIYYRNYLGMTPIVESGLETGEYAKSYGEVKSIKAYVKSAIGSNATEPFGELISKQRTVYVESEIADINEYSQVWVGIDPKVTEGEPTVPYNFDVLGVAVGLNHTRISIKRVEKSVG